MCVEKMIKEFIEQQGIKIQRWRLRDSIHRMDSIGVHERKRWRLHRKIYNVKGPIHLSHINTNQKLVRWRFIIAGKIDGFSRLVFYAPEIEDRGAYCFCPVCHSVILSFCNSVLLSETLTLLITFEQWVLELWYFTWVFLVIRPFSGYNYF